MSERYEVDTSSFDPGVAVTVFDSKHGRTVSAGELGRLLNDRLVPKDAVVLDRQLVCEAADGLDLLAGVYESDILGSWFPEKRREYRLLRSAVLNTAARLRSALEGDGDADR